MTMLKTTFLRLTFCFGALLMMFSCQEQTITPNAPNLGPDTLIGGGSTSNPADEFFAKVDGANFNETLLTVMESAGTINITASENASFPSMGLQFPSDITPGNYTFSGQVGDYRGIYNTGSNFDQMFYAEGGVGSIQIISHDLTGRFIQGIFNFNAIPVDVGQSTPTYSITAGSFAVSY